MATRVSSALPLLLRPHQLPPIVPLASPGPSLLPRTPLAAGQRALAVRHLDDGAPCQLATDDLQQTRGQHKRDRPTAKGG